jgi:nitroimidazol reductase NimA-like FMN-containing flavoprotein (pyridoxamine 5'-phosphate oxidase superfamily)
MINQMSDAEAWTMLRNGKIGRLGCIADNYPYVVPIHYMVEGDRIYAHSLCGRKINALRTNSRACLQMDQVHDECHWRSVIAYGTYREVVNQEECGRILEKLFARFPTLTPVESSIASDAAPSPIIVISIQVERITGVGERLPYPEF